MHGKYYHPSQEALVLRSLREIIKIWSAGSGVASLAFDVIDGQAELKPNFNLDSAVPSFMKISGLELPSQPKGRKRKKSP